MKKIFNSLVSSPWWLKLSGVLILGLVLWLGYRRYHSSSTAVSFQTQKVIQGTLVTSISGTGTITSGNSTNIKTAASGTIARVYVKNGDTVTKGQKIAELTLDNEAKKKRSDAWLAYIKAQEAVLAAQAAKVTADISMWQAHQTHLSTLDDVETKKNNTTNPATKKEYTESEKVIIDKKVDEAYLNFKTAEQKYQDADVNIANARIKTTSTYDDYLQYSPTIVAPSSGVVNNLVLAPGIIIEAVTNSNTSNDNNSNTISSQTIGIVTNTNNQFQATLNLTETDIPKIKADQKVNLALDAFPDKTFTGKVLAVNTSGTTTSGVTSYPVTVLFDPTTVNIYSKMAVSAQIITGIFPDVLLVPNISIQSINGASQVQIKKDNQLTYVAVSTGETDGTNTIVTTGLQAGDEVVISNSADSASQDNTSSPFSSTNRSSTRNSGSSIRSSGGDVRFMVGGPPGM
jgi:HlyD family secretion protein